MQPMEEEGRVTNCTVEECSYNQNRECHAPAIEVGTEHPMCDTFTTSQVSQSSEAMPMISRCDVDVCKFNESLMCHAPGITVDHHSEHADCLTYTPASPSA